MPTTLKLHHTPHIDPLFVYRIALWAVSAIMFGVITLLLWSAFIH